MKRCYSCFKEYDDAYQICPHCGQVEITRPKEAIHLMPGTVLADRYVIGEAVGSGGFGIVYRAWDRKLETVVAVKEFFVSRMVTRAQGLKNLIVSKKSHEEFEYRKERFLAEARNMAKFGAHRSIPNIFEFFEENNTAYIVMELLNGVALNDYLNQCGGKIDVDFALMIAGEVGNALCSLHEQNIIHRDVAPDNIFICSGKDIRIKLMDLGAAKLADSTDQVIDIILKPGYSPVEQYDNSKNIGPWTDVYALGATLYLMVTGVKPDEATNRKVADTVVPPQELNPLISENLGNAIMKAMALEKHMRFKNVPEFLRAIHGERKIIPLAKEKKRRRFRRFFGIGAAAMIVVLGAAALWTAFSAKQAAEELEPAEITVWFSVEEGSTEEAAMQSVAENFEESFPGVWVDLEAIPADEYEDAIADAAEDGELPTLFESTGLSDWVLEDARDLDDVISSKQFKDCLFLDQYDDYYSDRKRMPLGIEVPLAYVITSGAAYVNYEDNYFDSISDFGSQTMISADDRYRKLIEANFGWSNFADTDAFMNNQSNTSPVLLSSTMILNEVRTNLTNYEKMYVYPSSDEVYCRFTYEWSIGDGNDEEIDAAEMLLSWMLGNVYQSSLMISECSDGQIPVNETAFASKIEAKNLVPIGSIYDHFIFKRED